MRSIKKPTQQSSDLIWGVRNMLITERKRHLGSLCSLSYAKGQALTRVFNKITWAIELLSDTSLDFDPAAAMKAIQELERSFSRAFRNESLLNYEARGAILVVLKKLTDTNKELEAVSRAVASTATKVIVPVDLLYQVHQELFPAERMMVTSGRRHGSQVRLGAAFDVTGEHHAAHVCADPQKLAQALVAMERSGAHFACWWHSHPGTSPLATTPSCEDHEQFAGLVQNYSENLLGVIMVADGWIRFWGQAIEAGRIELDFIGTGIHRENRNDPIYRLAE